MKQFLFAVLVLSTTPAFAGDELLVLFHERTPCAEAARRLRHWPLQVRCTGADEAVRAYRLALADYADANELRTAIEAVAEVEAVSGPHAARR